jgi:hypothetical protein
MFRSKYKAMIIAGLLLLFLLIGSIEKSKSAPDEAPSTQVFPPSVGIYTADASAHVAVEVRVFDQGDAPSNELGSWFEVAARSSVATHILIVTHSAPVVPASNQFTAFSDSSADRRKYLAEFTLPVNRLIAEEGVFEV